MNISKRIKSSVKKEIMQTHPELLELYEKWNESCPEKTKSEMFKDIKFMKSPRGHFYRVFITGREKTYFIGTYKSWSDAVRAHHRALLMFGK